MIHIYPQTPTIVDDTVSSGAYVVYVTGNGGSLRMARAAENHDARAARALIAVRPSTPRAPLLVVLPLFTYHAYNVAEVDPLASEDLGRCLYTGARSVSLLRPGGGIGGHLWDERNADVYDRSSPRHTFAHWDAKALSWLGRNRYAYDVATDLDLHAGTLSFNRYRAIVSFGHHEYWTAAMRARIDEYVDGGGNVAFFGGNTMWFRLCCDLAGNTITRDGQWGDEWKTTGVTYARGGGRWRGARPVTAFVVLEPRHPIFRNLALRAGQRFGEAAAAVGYECDGAPPQSDLDVLARASLREWHPGDDCGERAPDGHAALGLRTSGRGEVFTASTADWARAMTADPIIDAITRNVLNRFLGLL